MQLHWFQHFPVEWPAEGERFSLLILMLKGWLICHSLLEQVPPSEVNTVCKDGKHLKKELWGVKVEEAMFRLQIA